MHNGLKVISIIQPYDGQWDSTTIEKYKEAQKT